MFKAIVETGRFTMAAQKLFVAQPSVSQQIHLLEEELGVKLFVRQKNRRPIVTEAGKLFKTHADAILRQCRIAQMEISALVSEPVGEVRLGLGGHQLTIMIPPVLHDFHAKFPKVRVDVINGTTPRLIDMLKSNQLDLAVVSLPVSARELRTYSLFTEELVLVVNSTQYRSKKKTVKPTELKEFPLVLYDQSTSTRQRLDLFFRKHRISPNVVFELSSVEAMKSMVEAGLGATIIPASALMYESRSRPLRILRIHGKLLTRTLGIAAPKSPRLPGVIEALVALLTKRFKDLGSSLKRNALA